MEKSRVERIESFNEIINGRDSNTVDSWRNPKKRELKDRRRSRIPPLDFFF